MIRKNKTSSYILLCLASVLALAVLLIPMLKVATCMVMTGDDYSFSTGTHQAVVNGGSVIGAAIDKTIEVYYSWQGSFSAVFLMTLQPGIWGYQCYWITTIIMLAALIGGLLAFCLKFFGRVFNGNKAGAVFVAMVLSIWTTQFLPLAYQSFYWYNGSIYYTFFFGLELITVALCTEYVLSGKKTAIVIAGIIAFIIGGGNYITALLGAIVLVLSIAGLAIKQNKRYRGIAIVFGFLLVAMIISVIAPGNGVRQSENPNHPGPVLAVIESLKYAVKYILKWSDLKYAAMLVAVAPVLWDISAQSGKEFRYPVFVTVIAYLLFASMFCPHVYAMGSPGPGRILNIMYFAFLLLSVICVFWWIGWIQNKIKSKNITGILLPEVIAAVLAGVLVLVGIKYSPANSSVTSLIAYNEIVSGEADGYYKENAERFAILEDDSVKNAELKALHNMPALLFSEDMKEDPDNYMNRDAATYFGKDSVIVK